jgi:hypothetical protein
MTKLVLRRFLIMMAVAIAITGVTAILVTVGIPSHGPTAYADPDDDQGNGSGNDHDQGGGTTEDPEKCDDQGGPGTGEGNAQGCGPATTPDPTDPGTTTPPEGDPTGGESTPPGDDKTDCPDCDQITGESGDVSGGTPGGTPTVQSGAAAPGDVAPTGGTTTPIPLTALAGFAMVVLGSAAFALRSRISVLLSR